jgi:hypothetical protein
MKTTILGVLTIVAGVVNATLAILKGSPIDIETTIISITAGIGLIKAADAK